MLTAATNIVDTNIVFAVFISPRLAVKFDIMDLMRTISRGIRPAFKISELSPAYAATTAATTHHSTTTTTAYHSTTAATTYHSATTIAASNADLTPV